jgi:hypothetical protein
MQKDIESEYLMDEKLATMWVDVISSAHKSDYRLVTKTGKGTETAKEPGTGRPLDYPTASPTATELVSQMATQMATQMETLSLSRSRSP